MGKKCIYCRNDMGVYTTKCPHCNSEQPPERKKPSLILGCGGVFFTFCFALIFLGSCFGHTNKYDEPQNNYEEEEYTIPAPKEKKDNENTNSVERVTKAEKKKSIVEIQSYDIIEDEGEQLLIVNYAFTNYEGKSASFSWTFDAQVFQDGIECEKSIFTKVYDTDLMSAEIKEGVTLVVPVGYTLRNNTNASVQVSNLINSKEIFASAVIELEGGAEITSDTDSSTQPIELSDYKVIAKSDGTEILVVDYKFCNTFDEPKSFAWTYTDKAFQNGIECQASYYYPDIDLSASSLDIQPGAKLIVTSIYELRDRSAVELEVSKYVGDDIVFEKTVDLE